MKKFEFLILLLICFSCNKNAEKKSDQFVSNFDLNSDYADFKNQLEKNDTLEIWFNHSVCTYQGYEKLEIIKFKDSIKIKSKFKEETYSDNPEWLTIYEKRISISDTNWKFEKFLERNKNKIKIDSTEYATLKIKYKNQKIEYFTDGLVDLNRFLEDYYITMRTIYPDKDNNIYPLITIID